MRSVSKQESNRRPPLKGEGGEAVLMQPLLAGRFQTGAYSNRGRPNVGKGEWIPVREGTLGKATREGRVK